MGIFFFSRGASESSDNDRRKRESSDRVKRDRQQRKDRRDQGRHPDNRR
jgi:hypothetical protein